MNNSEEIKKKQDQFNEDRLKNTALTFTLDGISKDLKTILQKKIMFNIHVTEQASSIIQSILSSNKKDIQNIIENKKSPIGKLLEHMVNEITLTNNVLNHIIEKLINKEEILTSIN